jgi:FkbM family methyltransferase
VGSAAVTVYNVTFEKLIEGGLLTFALDFDLNDKHQKIIFDTYAGGSCYEPDITALILRAVKPGDFVIDVGANIGVFTIMLAHLVGPEGKVLASEPSPENLVYLHRNIELNKLTNVEVLAQPFWDREEEVTFYTCSDSAGGHALWDPGLYAGNEETRALKPAAIKLPATLLSREIDRVGRRCAFIKVDTEGADEKILSALGFHRPPYVVAESNPFGAKQFGGNNLTFRQQMRKFGYDCFLIDKDDRLPAMLPDNTVLTNGFNGFVYQNLLFSTLADVGLAYPEAPNIAIPVEDA